jgi:hypothetical protein
MLDIKDFSVFEDQASFDFKGLLIKKLVTGNGFINYHLHHSLSGQYSQGKVYSMETLISVKEESNPFTSNTSLFLTGVELDQVQTISTTIQSRSHNELVVDKLQYYINYMVQGKYALEDAYGAVPFMLRSINPKGSWLEVSSVLNL